MEYSIEFSENLISAAKSIKEKQYKTEETDRAVLYLSLLSCEITLKSMLEKAGYSVKELKKRSHDLQGLLQDIGSCEVDLEDLKGMPATRVRSIPIDSNYNNATVGTLLEAEKQGASKYPNEIRYGDLPKHFPSKLMLDCAIKLYEWAKSPGNTIRRK